MGKKRANVRTKNYTLPGDVMPRKCLIRYLRRKNQQRGGKTVDLSEVDVDKVIGDIDELQTISVLE